MQKSFKGTDLLHTAQSKKCTPMKYKKGKVKLVLFDMDGTILKGRTIYKIAEKKGFISELVSIVNNQLQPYEKSIQIAQLLKGYECQELLQIFRQIPLQEHTRSVLMTLREKQIKTALVTDSYQCFANDLKKRVGFDFAFANQITIQNQILTGDLLFHNTTLAPCNDGKIYSICKKSVIEFLCLYLDIKPEHVIAVGDGAVDIDMLKHAGVGIAYNAPEVVGVHADRCTDDLRVVLEYV